MYEKFEITEAKLLCGNWRIVNLALLQIKNQQYSFRILYVINACLGGRVGGDDSHVSFRVKKNIMHHRIHLNIRKLTFIESAVVHSLFQISTTITHIFSPHRIQWSCFAAIVVVASLLITFKSSFFGFSIKYRKVMLLNVSMVFFFLYIS